MCNSSSCMARSMRWPATNGTEILIDFNLVRLNLGQHASQASSIERIIRQFLAQVGIQAELCSQHQHRRFGMPLKLR